jgi:hypothetical protein
MYNTVLMIHSWVRWAALILAVLATMNAFRPANGDRTLPGRGWDTLFMLAIDIQVLVGLFLYFGLSPITVQAMNNMSAAMGSPWLRFWAVEHAAGMFGAMLLVRMGRVLSANAPNPLSARKRRLVCFAIATIVMIAAVPWPGMTNARPLFRY